MTSKAEYCLLTVLLLIAGVAYVSRRSPVVRQADPAAYYYAGLAIADGGSPRFCDENNTVVGPYFTLLAVPVWQHTADPCLYLKYSIGLPILIALTQTLFRIPEAALYLVPVLGIIGTAALFALGQELFDRPTGLVAAGLLAFNFRYWYGATEIWSEVPSLAFVLIGILCVVRMIDRDDLWQGFLAGMMLGYGCLIRYPLAIALLPLALYFLSATRGQPKPRRALAGFSIGLGALALIILAYNKSVYGGFLTTGYSIEYGGDPWPAFSLSYFFGQVPLDAEGGWRAVAQTLFESFYPVGLLLTIGSIPIMPRAKAVLVGSFAALFCALYSLYFRPVTDVNGRHLLPAFAMICLAIAFGIVRMLRLFLGRRRLALVLILPLVIAAWHFPSVDTSLLKLERRNQRKESAVALASEFTRMTEPDAVFISREYHDYIILYGQRSALHYQLIVTRDPSSQSYQLSDYEPKLVEVVNTLLQNGIPVYLVREPENRFFREGPIDPYPILSAHFRLSPFRADPAVYRVLTL